MTSMHYVGLDIHKKTISFCEKKIDGTIAGQGTISATRQGLRLWASQRTHPWQGAMEATLFTGWIYDFLLPYADGLKVANPSMLKAITAAKHKNDRADAEMIADLLRVNLLPVCYMAPENVRELRRILRFRNLMVREATKMKVKTSGLLMEVGAEYNKQKLHGTKYFNDLLDTLDYIPESVVALLQLCRTSTVNFDHIQKQITKNLVQNPQISKRVELLQSIKGVGVVTALTWVLEIGDINRFSRISQVVSFCGLCSGQKESAGKEKRGPISKKRNKQLQSVLVEAAKLAPRWNPQLAEFHDRMLSRGNRNRATLAVARKLVAYLYATDKTLQPFKILEKKAA